MRFMSWLLHPGNLAKHYPHPKSESLGGRDQRQVSHDYCKEGYTEMTQKIPEQVGDKMTAEIPFRRFGEPLDIAGTVAF
ncbi:short-chain dehydrogenase/reductase SDR [Arthrospira sp. O9.13F]|nr:short-chain dehydrogenase/reductase SDR [Arthrospira sp. O9.13F]